MFWSLLCPPASLVVTGESGIAAVVSPGYKRSAEGYGACLKFRYSLYGPGAKSLKLFQRTNQTGDDDLPLWEERRNTASHWGYGQVSLSTISQYQVTTMGQRGANVLYELGHNSNTTDQTLVSETCMADVIRLPQIHLGNMHGGVSRQTVDVWPVGAKSMKHLV